MAQTGIDIEHDIDYVVAAMATLPHRFPDKSGLIVARGRFDIVKLEGLAREHGGTVEDYNGKRLVTPARLRSNATPTSRHPPRPMTIAFLEPGLVAVGESAAVKHAIDAQMSAQSITSNNEMMELVSDIERTNNAWAVGRLDVLTSHAQLPDAGCLSGRRGEVVRRRRHTSMAVFREWFAPRRATISQPKTCVTSSAASSPSAGCRHRATRI